MGGRLARTAVTEFSIALVALAAVCACTPAGAHEATQGSLPLVATTVSPLTSIASSIGGDRVRVQGIVPEGTNSHTFEPPPQTAELLSNADLVLVNGLQLEDPTADLARENLKPNAKIVELGSTVLPPADYIFDFSFPKDAGKPNPHLWTDPDYAIKYAALIRDEFSQLDPPNADYYARNYATFATQAMALADAVRTDQRTVPDGNLKLLTYHDAYAYFARDFGWEVIGAVQPRNFEDPTPSEVARLIDQVTAQRVPTIFGSEVFPSAVLSEIAYATGAHYEQSLRDDDLPGAPGDPDHSWLGLMKYDFVTMVKGLGGSADHLEALRVTTAIPDNAVYPQ